MLPGWESPTTHSITFSSLPVYSRKLLLLLQHRLSSLWTMPISIHLKKKKKKSRLFPLQTPLTSASFLCLLFTAKVFLKLSLYSLSPVFLFCLLVLTQWGIYHHHSAETIFKITNDPGHLWWAEPWKGIFSGSLSSKQFDFKMHFKKMYFKICGPMWDTDFYQWRFRIISSREGLTYLFIVPSLHVKILYRVQAPSTSVQMQQTSLLALLPNVLSLAARKRQEHYYCSRCHALKPVCIETRWFGVWVFCLGFFLCLCSSVMPFI